MLFNLLIILILYITVILYLGFNIFTSNNGFYKNLVNFLGLLAVSAIFIHFFYLGHIYFSLVNNFGNPGPRGIKGKNGKTGKKGICTAKCGQQACVAIIEDNINKHLEGNNLGRLDNLFMKNKINEMCFSRNYLAIVKKKFEKKPNEKEIIEYLSDICIKWVDTILQYKNGVRFLNGADLEMGYFPKGADPFEEIKKFEVWNWGSTYKMKPIIRKQCVKKVEDDKSGLSDLKLIFTNNYDDKPLFSNKMKRSIYGPSDCPFNQLGEDFKSKPASGKCYYYDDDNQSVRTETVWPVKSYTDFSKSFSFYNITSRYINGSWYFPLGTVWCGNNVKRPEKKTVMVEYNEIKKSTAFPISWKLIWTNMNSFDSDDPMLDSIRLQKNCSDCVEPENKICIWRPIAPEGFMALGDYVTQGSIVPYSQPTITNVSLDENSKPLNTILCIKKDCLNKIVINKETSVWSTDGFTQTVRNTIDETPKIEKYSRLSIWPCGINDDDEELSNYSSSKIEKITEGGYNLFRANNSSMDSPPAGNKRPDNDKEPQDPDGKFGYEIKGACYSIIPTEDEDYPTNELGIGWLGGKQRENKYSIFYKLGKPDSAIIKPYRENMDKDLIQNYKNIKLDIKDIKADTFVLQHYRTEGQCCENQFVIRVNYKDTETNTMVSGYLSNDSLKGVKDFSDDNKDILLWEIEPIEENKEFKYIGDNFTNKYFIVKIKSKKTENYLIKNNKQLIDIDDENSTLWTLDSSTGLNIEKIN